MFPLAGIRISGELAAIIFAIVAPIAVGAIASSLFSFIFKLFTLKLTPEERKKHITSKIASILGIIVLILGVLWFTLPLFGIVLLGNPLNIQ